MIDRQRYVRARLIAGACVSMLMLSLAGCGSRPVVSGTVKYKGDLLTTGEVSFIGADGKARSGLIGSDGRYEVADAPLGEVTIVVVATKADAAKGSPLGTAKAGEAPVVRSLIPRRYADPKTSKLAYKVAGGRQTKDIELEE